MKRITSIFTAIAGLALLSPTAFGQSGTWTNINNGLWSNTANWLNGIVADGSGNAADFGTIDITNAAGHVITLDSSRTLGNLTFSDVDTNTPAGWVLTTNIPGGQVLTLAGGTPTITVSNLAPGSFAEIRNPLAGTIGFTKAGDGEVRLTGINPVTGQINVDGGTLYLAGGNFAGGTLPLAITNNLRNGSTLSSGNSLNNVFVPAGHTGNLVARASVDDRGIGGGANSVLNGTIASSGGTFTAGGSWLQGGSLSNVNMTSTGANIGFWRLRANGSSFNTSSFSNTVVNLDRVNTHLVANSGGNTVLFGALNGTTNAVLQGASANGRALYVVGALNQDMLFEGAMVTSSGLNLQKVGAGVLTLSGTNITYGGDAEAIVARRGGFTTIDAGTLALTNGASLGRGIVSAGVEYFADITVNANGTYEFTGTTNNSTSPLTIVRGTGKFKGDYVHDEGVLTPGTDLVAGTMTFLNNLTITNNPSIDPGTLAPYALVTSNSIIRFDISPSLTSGNDRINVAGQVLVDGNPDVEVNFLGGASAGAYTLIYSTNGVVGSPSLWNVKWGGRGAPPTVTATANEVQLNVSLGAAGNLVWKGASNNVWDVNTTSNWFNGTTDDKFFQLDNVRFDDSLGTTLQSSITLNTIVTPASLVVSNDTSVNSTYTIAGTGQIGGGTSLDKRGTGTLTLTTANTYAGGTTNSGGGILDIGGTATALGAGALNMSGATFQSTFGSGAVTIANQINFAANTTNVLQADGAGNTIFGGNFTGPSSSRIVLQSTQVPKGSDFDGDKTGFTGTIQFASQVVLRLRSVASAGTSAIRWEFGEANATLGSLGTGTPRTYPLGYVSGGVSSTLGGHESSGAGLGSDVIWEIGAQGLDMSFGGVIRNGNQAGGSNTTSITKIGAGKLTLSGTSTYTGATTVSNGTLQVDGALGNTPVTVVSGTTLQGGGSIAGSVSVQVGATYSPGASIGAMTVGNLTLAGTTLMELDNAAATNSDRVTVTGTLNCGGTLNVVNLGGALASGDTFQLFLAANTTSSFSSISLPSLGGGLVWLTNRLYSEGVIQVASSSAVPLIWKGDGSANAWTIGGPLNWLSDAGYSGGTATSAAFADGLSVVIDETGSNNVPIALSGTVQPASVTVGAAKNYTLAGSGKISGIAGMTKGGSGALTVANNNDYSGATIVNNGLLQVDGQLQNSAVTVSALGDLRLNGLVQTATIGSGTLLDGAGTISSNLTVEAGGTLQPGVAGVGKLTVGGNLSLAGATVLELNQASPATNDSLQVTGTITAGGTLTVTNIGPELMNGTTFKLFSGAASGFASVTLPVTNQSNTAVYSWTDNLSTDGSITLVSGGLVNTNPVSVASTYDSGTGLLTMTWPSSHLGWTLQTQTNATSAGLTTNWFNVDGSSTVNQFQTTIDPANPTVFFRLFYTTP